MQNYNICYSFDSNYVEQFLTSIISLVRNAKNNESFEIHVLDGGLTKEDKNIIANFNTFKNLKINYISLNNKDFETCPLLKERDEDFSHYHVTLPTYYRFKLASLLPKIKNILYLDCDVIIEDSLEELFNTNIEKHSVAMVKDVDAKEEEKRLGIKNYFNAGIMLINLDFWRKENIEEKLFNYINENQEKIKWQDQDIINDVLQNSIKEIDTKWNYQYFSYEKIDKEELKEAKILHLSGRFKPWLIPFEHPIYDIYYFYLSLTPFYKKIFQYKFEGVGKFLKDNIGGRDTNILINATDKDIKELYENIDKVYKFISNSEEAIIKKTGKRINELYDEIQKNYNFMEESKKEIKSEIAFNLTAETDKKLKELYAEIKNNYAYMDKVKVKMKKELQVELGKQTDEKADLLYEEIKRNYAYMDETKEEMKKELEVQLTKHTDEKTDLLYEEIKRNYAYMDKVKAKMQKELQVELGKQTDEKNDLLYEEIKRNYAYMDETKEEMKKELEVQLTKHTDEKTDLLYEEIKRNYAYMDKTKEEMKKELEVQLTKHTDEKTDLLYDEIKRNYAYMDKTKEQMKKELEYHLGQDTDKKINEIYEAIAKNYSYVDEKKEETIKELEYKLALQSEEKVKKIYEEISNNYKYTEQLRDEVKFYADQKEEYLKNLISNNNVEKTQTIKTTKKNTSNNELEEENKKLNERIDQLEEELAICQINIAKLIKRIDIR